MRGRPKLNDDDKRNKNYVIRLRNDEYDNLKKLAARAGVSVSNYIRTKVFEKEENQ